MKYDEENDKFISKCRRIQIYPIGYNFHLSSKVVVEIEGDNMTLNREEIDTLISGLQQAKERLG